MNANVEIRITNPLKHYVDSNSQGISGLGELFRDSTYKINTRYQLIICSPWLEFEPFQRVADLLNSRTKRKDHELYILTCRDHNDEYEKVLKSKLEKLWQNPFIKMIIGKLPTKHNPRNFKEDILHAKFYFLLLPNINKTQEIEGKDIIEAYFGSANWTKSGTGIGTSDNKFEVIARVQTNDDDGKRNVYKKFSDIWYNCDQEKYKGEKWEEFSKLSSI